ncbi:MAG: hypothetical protein SGPRY_011691, partial [Prymnesium sp.]
QQAALHSIVDHHKLCGFKTALPFEVDIRPLCSTGSVLYARAKAAKIKVPPKMAALMLSCILSDSLEFRSPTTTHEDKIYAAELAKLANIDMHAHAEAMLDAKAEVGHLSPTELVMMDSKVLRIGEERAKLDASVTCALNHCSIRVSVIETTKPEKVLKHQQSLKQAMIDLRSEQELDDVLLMVIDILQERAIFISSSPSASELVERAWECRVSPDGTAVLANVLRCRKKQIVPALENAAAGGPPVQLAPCDRETSSRGALPERVSSGLR